MTTQEKEYKYDATLVRVIDGDTIILLIEKEYVLDIDFGFHIKDEMKLKKSSVQTFRLAGINTPEITGAEKAAGNIAKEALNSLCSRGKLSVISHGKDKYGRWLGTLIINLNDGSSINANEWLISEGYAKEYH